MVTQHKDTEYALPWKPRNAWLIPPGLEETIKRFKIQCISNIKNDNRPLLIHGPTGTGKSMFVDYYAFTYTDIKGKNPNIAYINCAALPSTLIDSLLFGHTKGAFTGADNNKIGYFESVKDGIIVLEELGEMPRHLQAKLLLAIESRFFSKLGSIKPIRLECQILATTNVQKEKFRDDLWYRFDIVSVPAIHKRRIDILYYMKFFNERILNILSPKMLFSLLAYNWPGNVREIEKVCNGLVQNATYIFNEINNLKTNFLTENSKIDCYNQRVFFSIQKNFTDLNLSNIEIFKEKLATSGINTECLEMCWLSSGLSLNDDKEGFGKDFEFEELITKSSKKYGEYFLSVKILEINTIYSGFLIFCKLFFQDSESNYDIFDLKEHTNKELEKLREHTGIIDLLKRNDIPFTREMTKDLKETLLYIYSYKNDFYFHFHVYGLYTYVLLTDNIKEDEHDDIFEYDLSNGHPNKHNYDNETKNELIKNKKIILALYSKSCSEFYESSIELSHTWTECLRKGLCESLKFLTSIKDINLTEQFQLKDLHTYNRGNIFLNNFYGVENNRLESQEIPIDKVTLDDLEELYFETILHHLRNQKATQEKVGNIAGRQKGSISKNKTFRKVDEKFRNSNEIPLKRIAIFNPNS